MKSRHEDRERSQKNYKRTAKRISSRSLKIRKIFLIKKGQQVRQLNPLRASLEKVFEANKYRQLIQQKD
ncbi:MAG: hypothetical protein AAGF83_05095 [Cyanobacteria bacterium P01_G01_bin.67]